jgi:hypothetical protein
MSALRTGKPRAKHDDPAHVVGVREGNKPHDGQPGHLPDGRVTARRSTGVNAKAQEVIDPRMPSLPPS